MAEQVNRLLRNQEADLSYLSPIDRLMVEREVTQAQPVSPTQRARNRLQTGEEVLGTLPVIGNAMSARDAYAASGEAYNALMSGNYKQAAGNALLAGISGVGAVTGLPTSKLAGRVARDAPDMASAFPAWHGSPHDFDRFDIGKMGSGEGAQMFGKGLYFAENPDVAKYYRDALKQEGSPGYLYKVEIDANPKDLIDWDKPLSKQRAHVRHALEDESVTSKLFAPYETQYGAWAIHGLDDSQSMPMFLSRGQAEDYVDELRSGYLRRHSVKDVTGTTLDPAGLTRALHDQGIPGLRYNDQFSRGKSAGTSNYVIFDDKLIKITGKE